MKQHLLLLQIIEGREALLTLLKMVFQKQYWFTIAGIVILIPQHYHIKSALHIYIRDINYLTELYDHKWSKVCKEIFKSALDLKNQMEKVDYYSRNPKRLQLENRLDLLLNNELSLEKKEPITFQKRLIKHREYLFTFLYRYEVPPDNNASERAIRNIKLKQKISGQFKSVQGDFSFAVLRSSTDTVLKNNNKVLDSLKLIANLNTD